MPETGTQPHILVVDDARDIREPLVRYLKESGYRASAAENAAVARRMMRTSGIDLVILREQTEGLFASQTGGIVLRDQVATDTLVMTRPGIERAVADVLGVGKTLPVDQGVSATTQEVGQAIVERLKK